MTNTEAVAAILGSAVVVLGGLAALTRSLLRIRDTIRDNTRATGDLTTGMSELRESLDGRFTSLEGRVSAVETKLMRRWRL